MTLFLKIISFPVRLALFLIIALIAGIVSELNHTLGIVLVIASSVVSVVGSLICGLTAIGGIFLIGGSLLYPDTFGVMKGNISNVAIAAVGLVVMSIPLIMMPLIAEKLYDIAETAADWTWGLAKMILFCDIDEIRYF